MKNTWCLLWGFGLLRAPAAYWRNPHWNGKLWTLTSVDQVDKKNVSYKVCKMKSNLNDKKNNKLKIHPSGMPELKKNSNRQIKCLFFHHIIRQYGNVILYRWWNDMWYRHSKCRLHFFPVLSSSHLSPSGGLTLILRVPFLSWPILHSTSVSIVW